MQHLEFFHEIECAADEFWERICFNTEFNKKLFLEHLGFPEYQVVDETRTGDVTHRKVKVTPKQEAPGFVKKLVGDRLSYVEEGTFDHKTQRYRFKIVTSAMGDKTKITGEMWTVAAGASRCKRHVSMDVEVKIFGVGGMVEGFVAKSTRDSYDVSATYTNKFLTGK